LAASGFGREDAIGGLIIFGIIFPLLARWTTLRARPLPLPQRRKRGRDVAAHCLPARRHPLSHLGRRPLGGTCARELAGLTAREIRHRAHPETHCFGCNSFSALSDNLRISVARFSMAVAFGLAHAPGFILRGAGLHEAIGTNPSAVDSIAYAIVVLSIAGIFFGIVGAHEESFRGDVHPCRD
jgi:hypothetical protein